jgi:glycosyltransferase involved in cell wall biosynthesis
MGASFDIIHYHAVGPGVMSPLPRFFSRTAVVQTIHGLDAERAKWGGLAKWLLNGATWLSARVPDVTVTVSQALADHYLSRYGRSCVFVPNGVDRRPPRGPGQLGHLGLLGNDYLLFVGRLVPEKNPDLLMRAFRDVETDQRLVLVGGSSYSDDYYKTLHRLAAEDKRVVMPGYIYGEVLEALYSNAIGFVLPSSLEGLPLTLLEAIESGLPVIASDIDPHVEVLEGESAGGRLFPNGDSTALTEAMRELLANVDSARHGASALRNRVLARYDWDKSVDCLEQVYATAMRRSDGP